MSIMRTVHRQEFKYIITYADYFKIVEPIKRFLIHDKHGENDSYQINSIYLDDLYHSGAMDKAFGNEVHKKYRIRYYDDENFKKLELKTKIGNDSTKLSTPITDELYQAIIHQDVDVMEKSFDNQLIRRFTLDMYRNHLIPSCNIIYKREAYHDKSDNVRVTFDHSLEVSEFDHDIPTESIKLMKDSQLILEIKYDQYLPKEVKTIINSISANQIAYSKYFLGYNQINM